MRASMMVLGAAGIMAATTLAAAAMDNMMMDKGMTVMVMPDGVIGGFYTLSSTALRLHDLPDDIAKRLPRYPLIPATLIGRLAIDRRHHGQGWGSFLLLDALHRSTRSQVASFAVIVDAIDNDARAFYVHQSFLPLPDTPRRLFRRMSDIEALFK